MTNTLLLYDTFKKHKSISIDTRIISPNSIFFALKGDNFDGNDYVEEALEKGSILAVCSNKDLANDTNIIYSEDTLLELQKLANYHRRSLKMPIIAITGTNGKTTTKDLISSVLAKYFRVSYTGGNKNNHIGVPLTLLSMNHTVDIGIVEMGANHQKEIDLLCRIAEPNYGIITNIGKAHLEGFKSLEGVKQAKAELYSYIKKNNGTIFYNADNKTLADLIGGYSKSVAYGQKSNGIFCHGEYNEEALLAAVKWRTKNTSGYAKSNLIGEYNFENILTAITVGCYFKVPDTAIDSAIASYFPRNRRSQLEKTQRNSLILDFYNANPTSMKIAIDNFAKIDDKNKCIILGDMLELGDSSKEEHRILLNYIKELNFKKVYLVGRNFYNFKENYEYNFFKDVNEIADFLIKKPEVGNFFLIKGSRGIKLEKCTDFL